MDVLMSNKQQSVSVALKTYKVAHAPGCFSDWESLSAFPLGLLARQSNSIAHKMRNLWV